MQRTGGVACLPDLPFLSFELVRFFRHQRTMPTRVHSLGIIHFPHFARVINSWPPPTGAGADLPRRGSRMLGPEGLNF